MNPTLLMTGCRQRVEGGAHLRQLDTGARVLFDSADSGRAKARREVRLRFVIPEISSHWWRTEFDPF
jgi:hypothetical protein